MNDSRMNNSITDIIQDFQSISLAEMDNVTLMNRVDSKYVFSIHQLPAILYDATHNYRILEINNTRQHFYDSLYFDTPDFQMYYKHLYKRLNRHKVRFRKYVNTNGLTFLEIKFKDNKQKTYKKRKTCKDVTTYIPQELSEFLLKQTGYSSEKLIPTLKIQYHRITLVNKNNNERVTIDTHLHFDNFETQLSFNNIVIAEVKRSSYTEHTEFIKLIKQHHIREGGLSKYCIGMALINSSLKNNNFLPKLKYLEKINAI